MKELRIGVVLYGGVSLAIYMNGITTELWQVLRAARLGDDGKKAGDGKGGDKAGAGGNGGGKGGDDRAAGATAVIYRDLLDEAGALAGTPIGVVVDTIAGTSAGGVNGVVLGHAIAHGSDAAVLNRVWVEEAGIEKLQRPAPRAHWAVCLGSWLALLAPWCRRKAAAMRAINIAPSWARDAGWALWRSANGSDTPLSGDYFARMISGTLAEMRRFGSRQRLLGRHNVLDLFLTQTDLYGWPRRLPVAARYHATPLFERTHAHVMRFRSRAGLADFADHAAGDFADEFALTYAARTTAGFPVAFPSASTQRLAGPWREGQPGLPAPDLDRFAVRYLNEHVSAGLDHRHAWMADGGFLDNKPFSHVADAIEGKAAEHEVTRAVIYVEPDPEAGVESSRPPEDSPGLLGLMGKMYGLFRHEPVQADLMRLVERNARAERIRDMLAAETARVDAVLQSLGQQRLAVKGMKTFAMDGPSLRAMTARSMAQESGDWRPMVNAHINETAQPGYAGYVQLKARRAAETLAETICRAQDYGWHTQQAWLVREIVRRLMDQRGALAPPEFVDGAYRLNEAQLELLQAFDFAYRLRRLRHIVRAVNALYPRPGGEIRLLDGLDLRGALDRIKAALADAAAAYEKAVSADAQVRAMVTAELGERAQIEQAMRDIGFDAAAALERFGPALERVREHLFPYFRALAEREFEALQRTLAQAGAALHEAGAPQLEAALGRALVGFPLVDGALLPMMDSAGVQDPIAIDALRLSPADATICAGNPKLKSSAMGAFAGFLDRNAREFDLALGRLHGAERIVDLVLVTAFGDVGGAPAGLRRRYRERLAQAVLAEQMAGASAAVREELAGLEIAP